MVFDTPVLINMNVLQVETRLSSFTGYPITPFVDGGAPCKSPAFAFLLLLVDLVPFYISSNLRHGIESFYSTQIDYNKTLSYVDGSCLCFSLNPFLCIPELMK